MSGTCKKDCHCGFHHINFLDSEEVIPYLLGYTDIEGRVLPFVPGEVEEIIKDKRPGLSPTRTSSPVKFTEEEIHELRQANRGRDEYTDSLLKTLFGRNFNGFSL